jgi:ATP/ADP translocase
VSETETETPPEDRSMPLRNAATPSTVRRWSLRIIYVTAPLTLALLVAWVFWPTALDSRDYGNNLLFALYQLFLVISLSAGIVAALASGQIATARAFTAGYNTGLAVAQASQEIDGDGDGAPWPKPIPLRLLK